MVVTCKLYDKVFDLQALGIAIPSSPLVENITDILHQLNNFNVCIGGLLQHQYSGVHTDIAQWTFAT